MTLSTSATRGWTHRCQHERFVNTAEPVLDVSDFVYYSQILKDLNIQYFTMRDIDRLGIQRVMEVSLDHLLSR